MATSRGKSEVLRFIERAPEEIITKVLRGAARAGGTVIAGEAKDRSISEVVSEGVKVRTKRDGTRVVATVYVEAGWARSVGTWLEYGTAPHFIRVDASQSGGRTVSRINRLTKENGGHHSLVIGGQFVGETVFHPGAQRHPFLRVALDLREGEAMAAARGFIASRITRRGIVGEADQGDTE